MKHPPL